MVGIAIRRKNYCHFFKAVSQYPTSTWLSNLARVIYKSLDSRLLTNQERKKVRISEKQLTSDLYFSKKPFLLMLTLTAHKFNTDFHGCRWFSQRFSAAGCLLMNALLPWKSTIFFELFAYLYRNQSYTTYQGTECMLVILRFRRPKLSLMCIGIIRNRLDWLRPVRNYFATNRHLAGTCCSWFFSADSSLWTARGLRQSRLKICKLPKIFEWFFHA